MWRVICSRLLVLPVVDRFGSFCADACHHITCNLVLQQSKPDGVQHLASVPQAAEDFMLQCPALSTSQPGTCRAAPLGHN